MYSIDFSAGSNRKYAWLSECILQRDDINLFCVLFMFSNTSLYPPEESGGYFGLAFPTPLRLQCIGRFSALTLSEENYTSLAFSTGWSSGRRLNLFIGDMYNRYTYPQPPCRNLTLKLLIQGHPRSCKLPHIANFKGAYIFLIIGPRGVQCETNL